MKKKILTILIATLTFVSLIGCGNTENETQDVVKVEQQPINEESLKEISVIITNDLNYDISSLYITMGSDESWGDNLIKDGLIIKPGEYASGITVTYSDTDNLIDIAAYDPENSGVSFEGIDVRNAVDGVLDVVLVYEAETDSYQAKY